MYPYAIVFLSLWAASGLEFFFKVRRLTYFLGFVAIIFLSLRFETGYDWPAYQQLFNLTPSIYEADVNDIFEVASIELKEPFFVLFISLLKGLGGGFQFLLVVCALFQIVVFVKYLSRLKENSATIFTLSFSWLLFTLYMSTLRQGLAVSFFLLFMIFMEQRRKKTAISMLIIGICFQYSSVVYILMYLVADYVRWSKKLAVVCFLLMILALFGVDSYVTILKIISMAGFEMINSKIEWYINGYSIPANKFELIYNLFFSSSVLLILYFSRPANGDTVLVRKMYGMSILFCILCLLFYNFPLMRNRVQYLVLPFCYFFVVRYFSAQKFSFRFCFFIFLFLINALYFFLFLEKASSTPFLPYQNYINYIFTGDPGDGAARYEMLE